MIRSAATLAVAAFLTSPAIAGDAAALRVLGFSPDGTVFAFETFTMIYEDDASFSEYIFVDTRTDRFLPGTPVRVLVRGEDGFEEKKAREDAAGKAAPLIAQHRIGEPGTRHEGKPSMELADIGIYQMDTKPLAASQEFALPDGRKAVLAITTRPLGSAICDGMGGRATPGRAKVAGFRLTLTLAGKPLVLHEDKSLPKARRCVSAYGIAEAYLHTTGDGTLTLAAIVETVDNDGYHAGPNRRFMAVTKRLPAPGKRAP